MLGRILDILQRLDTDFDIGAKLWTDTGYVIEYLEGYQISGRISERIPDIWQNI